MCKTLNNFILSILYLGNVAINPDIMSEEKV